MKIKAVSIDMREPFIASTKSNVTDAESKIVFDRLHIMKHMNIALDEVMKMETKNADTKELLKKIKYMQIYSFENLNDKYRKKYDILKESNLNTARAYAIKENLRNLRRSGAQD